MYMKDITPYFFHHFFARENELYLLGKILQSFKTSHISLPHREIDLRQAKLRFFVYQNHFQSIFQNISPTVALDGSASLVRGLGGVGGGLEGSHSFKQ